MLLIITGIGDKFFYWCQHRWPWILKIGVFSEFFGDFRLRRI